MRFTEAERAAIGAELRKLRAEGKDRVHVIPSRGGWRVLREGTNRGKRAFQDKEEAIGYGRDLAKILKKELLIHTKDAGLEARERYSDLLSVSGGSGR